MNNFIRLENLFFFLLALSLLFVEDFIPNQVSIYIATLLILKIFFQYLAPYFIYTLIVFLIYLLNINFDNLFTPEASASLLLSLCSINILQKYKSKNKKIEYVTGILFLAVLTLFNSTIAFVIFLIAILALAMLLISEYKFRREKINYKNIALYTSFIGIITLFLFTFFPRVKGVLPKSTPTRMGEVGYSKEIINSQVSNLTISEKVAFYAIMDKIERKSLYWRARVLNYTDGYNWRSNQKSFLKTPTEFNGKNVNYQIKYEQSFYGDMITLDVAKGIEYSKLRYYEQSTLQTFHSYERDNKNIITATSYLSPPKTNISNWEEKLYLQHPKFIPKSLKTILKDIPQKDSEKVIKNIKTYLKENGFKYTLNPGPMPTMSFFLKNKKGFCTHYSSLLALALRVKKIPSRIITGFQGGTYNEVSSSYTVKASDAHAWVEYWNKDKWIRVDPTSFVSPLRTSELYSFNNLGEISKRNSFNFPIITKFSKFYESLNISFLIFMDNIDQSFQNQIAKKINLSLNFFYFIGFSLVIGITSFFYYFLKSRANISAVDKEFNKFIKRMKKNQIIILPSDNFKNIESKIDKLPEKKKVKEFAYLKKYQSLKYSKNH